MGSQRTIKTVTMLASLSLLVGAYAAAPAEAAKKKRFSCAPATATPPAEGHSSNAEEAAEAQVVNLTAAATEEKPLVIEYEHGPAFSEIGMEDTKYFAFQVVSKTLGAGVYVLQEWPGRESDIDLYMSDESGAEVASSGAFNPIPVPPPGSTGGPGYESISGYPAEPCSPYTIESKAYLTPGEEMTLKLWLGEAAAPEE